MSRAGVLAAFAASATVTACSVLFGVDEADYSAGHPTSPSTPEREIADGGAAEDAGGDAGRSSLHLYVIGGSVPRSTAPDAPRDPTDKVYFATIDENGEVGPFTETQRLLVPVRNHTAVAYGRYIYVFGGGTNQSAQSDGIYSGEVREDGSIAAWTKLAPPGFTGRQLHASALIGRHAYVIGGLANGQALGDILGADLRDDGTVGPFGTDALLDAPAFAAAAAAHDRRLYVLGGLAGGATRSTVLGFDANDSGSLTAAPPQPELLPGGACYFAAADIGDAIVTVGAVRDGDKTVTNVVSLGRVDGSGLEAFAASTALDFSQWSHAVSVGNGRIYVTGGLGPNGIPRYDHVLIGERGRLDSPDTLTWRRAQNGLPQPLGGHASVIR